MFKKFVVLGISLVVLAFAGNAGALPVTITDSDLRADTFSGGPFIADVGAFDFLTFCIEWDEHISLPGTYDYTLSMYAVNGGNGGPDPDPLDSRTAYLYSRFRGGIIGQTAAAASDLQLAIWFIEDESVPYELTEGARSFIVDANANSKGLFYGVRVMNLTSSNGTIYNQSMLFVPETSAFLLLGSGLFSLGLLRRRMKKA